MTEVDELLRLASMAPPVPASTRGQASQAKAAKANKPTKAMKATRSSLKDAPMKATKAANQVKATKKGAKTTVTKVQAAASTTKAEDRHTDENDGGACFGRVRRHTRVVFALGDHSRLLANANRRCLVVLPFRISCRTWRGSAAVAA